LPDYSFQIIYVNDGSTDGTEDVLRDLARADSRVTAISLARNFGHQMALTCGMDHSDGEAVICLDSDLQHPPGLIPLMLAKWEEGYQVVYTLRQAPHDHGPVKRLTSSLFYKIINRLSPTPIVENAADFRLMSRPVVELFKHDIRERVRFLRGLVSWVGFKSLGLPYQAADRVAGQSTYTLRKMASLAVRGLLSFSTAPLKLALGLGFFCMVVSLADGLYAIYTALFTERAVPGWASVVTAVTFLFAVQFFILGIFGQYLGYILEEVKHRPLYVIASKVTGAGPHTTRADQGGWPEHE
jgi:dolichol-phosphate mannosyltransferase